jgi:hypothetical protein
MLNTIGGGGGFTVTVTLPLLFAEFGSASFPVTLALAVIGPELGFITMVTPTFWPTVMLPMPQVTVAAVAEQLPCVAFAETKLAEPGIGAETVTPLVIVGPLLVTPIV